MTSMACTMTAEEKAALKVRIATLEAAYDDIITGKAIKRFVDQNGEQVEYNTANASTLLAYIRALKSELDCAGTAGYKPKPLGFVFPRQ